MEKVKRGLARGLYCKAKNLLANTLDNHYLFAALLLLAASAAVQLVGKELIPLVFAEQSPVAALPEAFNIQQVSTGKSYYRSVSESFSVVASYGSGSSAKLPASYYRSISDTMSVSTIHGKPTNSYSRSITEQASLSTGMPPSSSASQPVRVAPTPYSVSSVQRIDERFNLRNLPSGKADTAYRGTIAGTPIYSTDSIRLNAKLSGSDAGIIILDNASVASGEDEPADYNSELLRQIDDVLKDYVLMQEAIHNAALLQTSISGVLLIGTLGVVANQPATLRAGQKIRAFFLLKHKLVDYKSAISKKTPDTRVTIVLLVVLVIFMVSSIVSAIDPFAGQAFAAISYVGAGNAASDAPNNSGTLVPSLPSGLQADDMMVVYYYSRTTTGSVSISAGWTTLYDHVDSSGHIAVWYRFYQSGDSAPTISASGLATGPPNNRDDIIAQSAAWRGVDTADPIDVSGTVGSNTSQLDIGPITGITLGAGDTVIVLGGKSDDWTSVATLTGDLLTWNEIGEPVSTTGADAGLVWDYAINGGPGSTVTSKTFTVTGGNSEVGKGVMFSLNAFLQNYQANPSETLAMTEIIATNMGKPLFEQLLVTDQLARTITINRAASEQLAANDTITKDVSKALIEQIALSETANRAIISTRSILEQMGVNDTLVKSVSKSVTESVVLADTVVRSVAQSRAMSEEMVATDSIAKALSKSFTEELTIIDTLVRGVLQSRSISEELVMTDVISKSASYALTEQLVIEETLTREIMTSRAVAESLLVQDSVTKSVSITVIEALLITETVAKTNMPSRLSIDELAVTEAISIAVTKPLFEELGLTDTLQRSTDATRTLSEQLTMTDAVTKATSYTFTEELSIQDTLNKAGTSSRSATETLAVQDTIIKAVSTTITEQILMADQATRAATQSRSSSEQLGITDTMIVFIEKSLSESLAISEAIARSVAQSRPKAEQLTMQDTISISIVKTLSEQFDIIDALARTSTVSRDMSEDLTLTDAIAIASSRSLAEQFGISDTIQQSAATTRTMLEQLVVTDAIAKSISTSLSEQLTVAETIARSFTISRSLLEEMTVQDSMTKAVTVPLSEQLGLQEVLARFAVASGAMSEQLTLTDSISVVAATSPLEQLAMTDTTTKAVTKSVSESLSMSDSLTKSVEQSGQVSDQLTIVDSIAASTTKSVSEQFGIADSPARSVTLSRSMTEQIIVTDVIEADASKTATEQLAIEDTINRTVSASRSISEQMGLTESVTMSIVQSVSLNEGLSLADSVSGQVEQSRFVSEQLALTEAADRSVLPSRSQSEQLVLTDSLSGVISVSKTVTEQISLQDTISVIGTFTIVPAENMSVAESAARDIAVTRTISEQLAVADTITVAGQTISLSESLTLSESVVAGQAISRSMSEQLAATESVTKTISITLAEAIKMGDSVVVAGAQGSSMSEQVSVAESISLSIGKPLSEQLSVTESIMAISESGMSEQLIISDAILVTSAFARAVSENLTVAESASKTTTISIIESLIFEEEFTDISIEFHLTLVEMLVLPDSLTTDNVGDLDSFVAQTITVGDSVILTLSSGSTPAEQLSVQDQLTAVHANGRELTESMQIQDSRTMVLVVPSPAIATMPSLTMTETEYAESIAGPMEAVQVEGEYEIDGFDNSALEYLLVTIGMPVYDVSVETSSSDIDQLTVILPTFNVPIIVGGMASSGETFLTPTLSHVPADMRVMIPIDMAGSLGGAGNLVTDQMVVSFMPAVNATDFAIMITIVNSNPEEEITQEQPDGLSGFYIDASYVGTWSGGLTPSDEAFFEEPPRITFTVTEEWAEENEAEKDANNVPIMMLFLLDEVNGEWIEISGSSIDSPTTAVGGIYTYTATLPHFSTYVVTASTEAAGGGSNGGGGGGSTRVGYVRSIVESLFITGIANFPAGGEGAVLVKDFNESLTLGAIQPQPLHQRVITIHDLSIAVNVADIKSGGVGNAIAILNLEITNAGNTEEMLMLKYWYTDPATGQRMYETEQAVMIDAGESIIERVDVPFGSSGLYDITIEVESKDGTVSTTDIAIEVPWLSVYLYILIAVAILIVAASMAYIIWSICRHRSLISGGR